jgi:hypothetical protein
VGPEQRLPHPTLVNKKLIAWQPITDFVIQAVVQLVLRYGQVPEPEAVGHPLLAAGG